MLNLTKQQNKPVLPVHDLFDYSDMKRILTSIYMTCAAAATAADFSASDHLWYKQPAGVPKAPLPWLQAPYNSGNLPGKANGNTWESQTLPVGNGRIGGTVYGGDRLDCVVLNEVSLWSGGPNEPGNGHGYKYGPLSGKNEFGNYQPFANLYVSFDFAGTPTHYTRSLDLRQAEARVSFEAEGVTHERSCFVSRPDNVMVYTAQADKAGSITVRAALTPYHSVSFDQEDDNTIVMSGTLANGEEFEGRMYVRACGGTVKLVLPAENASVTYTGGGDNMRPVYNPDQIPYIEVKGADKLEIYISMATNYAMSYDDDWEGDDPDDINESILESAVNKGAEAIRESHRKDFGAYYDRMSLDLGKSAEMHADTPTDVRLEAYRLRYDRGLRTYDPDLEELIYNYGRYILISSSQPGNLPANLQGIWNNRVHAPWASDYHNNINLQMCYWAAEVTNLSECHQPLIDFIRAMEEPLTISTRKHFGKHVRGWTTRISQNPWGAGGWVKWNPPVNAWYALHLWDRYLYSQDEEYLRKIAYPLLKTICHFWEDELKEVGAQGKGLQTRKNEQSPVQELSVADHPELAEIKAGSLVCPMGWSHEWGPLEDGCAHDQQLIWELFDNTSRAADILGEDKEWAAELRAKRDRLVGNRIGKGGYLQEWIVDRPNMLSSHRHTSHLIGVFPGTSISLERTPEFAKAAMRSLELRGLSQDNRRSWTWPWRTALWARFREADKAYSMVQHYIRYNLLDNLFGNHPPMQMDGTFGMPAGISEMLLQSHAGVIELLPAIPRAWKNGSVRGLRARGNITVDMAWKNGKVTSYKLTTTTGNPAPVTVVANGKRQQITPEVVK